MILQVDPFFNKCPLLAYIFRNTPKLRLPLPTICKWSFRFQITHMYICIYCMYLWIYIKLCGKRLKKSTIFSSASFSNNHGPKRNLDPFQMLQTQLLSLRNALAQVWGSLHLLPAPINPSQATSDMAHPRVGALAHGISPWIETEVTMAGVPSRNGNKESMLVIYWAGGGCLNHLRPLTS